MTASGWTHLIRQAKRERNGAGVSFCFGAGRGGGGRRGGGGGEGGADQQKTCEPNIFMSGGQVRPTVQFSLCLPTRWFGANLIG